MPIMVVVVCKFEEKLGEGLLLTGSGPEARLNDGPEVDVGVHVPHHGFFPPADHVVCTVFDEFMHPADISNSVDVIKVGPD